MIRRPAAPLLRPSSRGPGSASHRSRRALVALPAALALTLGLGACSATNPITTVDNYAPSDGVLVQLGDLRVNNLLVVSAAEGRPGVVIGAITNDGSELARVAIGPADADPDATTSVSVGPGETVLLAPDSGETVELESVPAAPGAMLDLTVSTESSGSTSAQVPVLDGTLPSYADLVPQG